MSDAMQHRVLAVQHAIESLDAHLAIHCVAHQVRAIVIVRQDDGFVHRRSIGPQGVVEIPEYLDDSLALYRFGSQEPLTDEQLLSLDQAVRDARARGERVLTCPADGAGHVVHVAGAGGPPAGDDLILRNRGDTGYLGVPPKPGG